MSYFKYILFGNNSHKDNSSPDASLKLQIWIPNCQFNIFICLAYLTGILNFTCLKEHFRLADPHQLPPCPSAPYSQWKIPLCIQVDHEKKKKQEISLDSPFPVTPNSNSNRCCCFKIHSKCNHFPPSLSFQLNASISPFPPYSTFILHIATRMILLNCNSCKSPLKAAYGLSSHVT